MAIYSEPLSASEPMRKIYADSVSNAAALLKLAAKLRRERTVTPERMAARREEFREEYIKLLGIDTCREVFGVGAPEAERTFVGNDEFCRIERMVLKLCDGVSFTGLLLTPHRRAAKAPFVVMSHGGGGSPELCSGFLGKNNYGGEVQRLLSRGCIVFAPQLLLWSLAPSLCESAIPTYTTPYDRVGIDNILKQCGASIAGFEIYCITRAIDWLTAQDFIDPERGGMLGLSYGGFYTLYTMACDTRLKSGWSAAFFNDRTKYCWRDFVWMDSAGRFLDAEIAGLCAPRRLWLDVGTEDTVFSAEGVEEHFERAKSFFAASDAKEQLKTNLWKGGHRFSDSPENESSVQECPSNACKAFDFFLEGMGVFV